MDHVLKIMMIVRKLPWDVALIKLFVQMELALLNGLNVKDQMDAMFSLHINVMMELVPPLHSLD
jgi:hypothetical protein